LLGWIGGKEEEDNVQADDAENEDHHVTIEDVGDAEGKAEDHGQDAEPGFSWSAHGTRLYLVLSGRIPTDNNVRAAVLR
jgi:hypothetical protein